MVILTGSLWTIEDLPLSYGAAFVSIVAIMFGGKIMVNFPMKALLISLLLVGVWWFLVLLPIFYLPLPSGIPPLAGGLSLLLLVLLVGLYEKRNAKKDGKSVEKEGK
jgi:hypothetical protein